MSAYREILRAKTKGGADLSVTQFHATEANLVGVSLTIGELGLHIRVGLVDGRPEVTIADRSYATQSRITAAPQSMMVTTTMPNPSGA